MPPLTARLWLLEGEPPEAVVAILAGTLRDAGKDEQLAICRALLENGRPEAAAAVITGLHQLEPAVRKLAQVSRGSLEAAVGLLRKRGRRQPLLNAIALAAQRADLELLPHLVGLLESRLDDVAPRAADGVIEVLVAHTGANGRRRPQEPAARAIDAAVAEAVSSHPRHRQGRVLLAACLLADRPGPRLGRILADPDHPVLFSLRGAVSRTRDLRVRRNLIRWLAIEPLAGQAARWIHQVEGTDQYADLLADGHLLLAPCRRRAIRSVSRPLQCLPDLRTAMSLPAAAQVNVVRLIRALPLSSSLRNRYLADAVALPNPVARLAALSDLGDVPEAAAVIDRLCFDRDEAVASLAAQPALRRGGRASLLLRRLERTPYRLLARRASAHLAAASVEGFFERWRKLQPGDRLVAGWRLATQQRGPLVGRLAAVLGRGIRADRIAGIALARRLGLVGDLEAYLVALADDGDSHVASSAVAALADGGTGRRLEAIRGALARDDDRVQANALEALRRIDGRAAEPFASFTDSRSNRLRANALRALLPRHTEEGLSGLRAMITDRDPLHRVSGVWVARRCRSTRVLADLQRLADHDRFLEVRTRAAAAVRLLQKGVLIEEAL